LRAIRLFTSKIADSVIEGRALATEHDFTADKAVDDEARGDETAEDITAEYSQYVDPKYAEQIMQESLMLGSETKGEENPSAGRKGPASETSDGEAAEAGQV
jgi:small subunit ribosomal protein S2